jgi:hypothetical protein
LDSTLFIALLCLIGFFIKYKESENKIYLFFSFCFATLVVITKPIYLPILIFYLNYDKKYSFLIIFILFVTLFHGKIYEDYPLNKTLFSLKAQKSIVFSDPLYFFKAIINFFNSEDLLIARFIELIGTFGWMHLCLFILYYLGIYF